MPKIASEVWTRNKFLLRVAWCIAALLILAKIVSWVFEQKAKYGGFTTRLLEWVRTQDTTNRFYAWELPGAIWFGGIVLFLVFVAGSLVKVMIDTWVKAAADRAKEKTKR